MTHTGEHAGRSDETTETDGIVVINWDTYVDQTVQAHVMRARDVTTGREVCVGFVIENIGGVSQAFLTIDPNELGSALLVSSKKGTDVDTAIDALEGAYAASQAFATENPRA